MAFELKFFNPVGGQSRTGNAQARWNYRSPDDGVGVIRGSGYFNDLRDMVEANDPILIHGSGANFQLAYFGTVPKSPSTADVTMATLNIVAA